MAERRGPPPITFPHFAFGAGAWEHAPGYYAIGLNFDGEIGGPGPREVVDMTGIAAGYRVKKRIQHGDVDWLLTYNGTDTRVYRVESSAWVNKSGSRFVSIEGLDIVSFGDVVAVGFGTAQAYEFSSDDGTSWTASTSTGNAKYFTRAMIRGGGLANPRVDFVVDPDELYATFNLAGTAVTTSSTIGDGATDQDYFTSLTETDDGVALIGKRRALWSYDSDGLAVKLSRDFLDPPADAGGQGDRRNFEVFTNINGRVTYVVEGYKLAEYYHGWNEQIAPKHAGPQIPRMDLPINALTQAGDWIIAALGSQNTATLKNVAHAPGGSALLQNTFGTTSDLWKGRYQPDPETGQMVMTWHGVLLETTDPLRYMWYREDDGYLYLASGDSESADLQQRRCYFPIEAPATHAISSVVTLQTGTWRVESGRIYPGGGPLEPARLVSMQARTLGLASSTPSLQVLYRVVPDHETSAYVSLVTWTDGYHPEGGVLFPPSTVARVANIDFRGAGNSGANTYALLLGAVIYPAPYQPPGLGRG